jgi:hypothetical protein
MYFGDVIGGLQRTRIRLIQGPAGDTVRGRGISLGWRFEPGGRSPDASLTEAVYVLDSLPARPMSPHDRPTFVGPLEAGAHALRLLARATDGAALDTMVRFVVRLDAASHDAVPLAPDAEDSEARALHEDGTIVGSVTSPGGRGRAAMWRAGARSLLGGEGTRAVAVNAAGEVLVQDSTLGQVFRADDGALLRTVDCGPFGRAIDLDAQGAVLCRSQESAVVRRDGRHQQLALPATGTHPYFPAASDMAADGTIVGAVLEGCCYKSTRPVRWRSAGDVPEYLPGPPLAYPRVDSPGRYSVATPQLIDDAGYVVVIAEIGAPYLIHPSGLTSDLYAPLGGARPTGLANGEIVAFDARDSTVWRSGVRGVERVRLADPDWTIDATGPMDGRGRILAHGVNRRTGARGAVMLVPTGGP